MKSNAPRRPVAGLFALLQGNDICQRIRHGAMSCCALGSVYVCFWYGGKRGVITPSLGTTQSYTGRALRLPSHLPQHNQAFIEMLIAPTSFKIQDPLSLSTSYQQHLVVLVPNDTTLPCLTTFRYFFFFSPSSPTARQHNAPVIVVSSRDAESVYCRDGLRSDWMHKLRGHMSPLTT